MALEQIFNKKLNSLENLPNYRQAVSTLLDVISPTGLKINPNFLKLGEKYCSTLFILTYPNYLASNWFSVLTNLNETFDISIYFHPLDANQVLRMLRKKSAEVQAQISLEAERGLIRNPLLETALQNIEELRNLILQQEEKLFDVGVYITYYADSQEELKKVQKRIESLLEQLMIYAKPAVFRMYEGFESSLPLGLDRLLITNPLNSQPASTLFPFVSVDLTSNKGILYGINQHNSSLIIFDRFTLPNANMIVLAQSGAGKSYAIKLEILRSLLLGTDILIIDPEYEYAYLTESIGGSYFKIAVGSEDHINPFDMPIVTTDESNDEVFRSHILNLIGLIKLMVGGLTPQEEIILDSALNQTYASRDIFAENINEEKTPPLLEDLEEILKGVEGGEELSAKLYKYTKGTYAGFFNQQSNIDIGNRLVVFGIRDLEEELRPIAMYVVLNYIWTSIRKNLKKRLTVVDEGWWLLKHEESASFLFNLIKRARKYYMGVTFISQDIEDALNSPYGKPMITNSSLALLLRQSPANIDIVGRAFNLNEQEKSILLQATVGTGLFFAGDKHAAIQILASYAEDQIITSNPAQILEIQKTKEETQQEYD
ncbi:MAG TPA: ATP-binding protein [Candidatus Paceibacterota bacterium]|nr:ATP-binding protein [Candidatus Paceibacterota bacterium]HOK97324.1 ATP-binding protein [Candidatus Paceibacterota bacterium]HPP64782.1 ATP-binding protein [Candidatus Paceibacterota bacterium]